MLGKFTNMNFDFICKISLKFSKMGITFAYELGLKSFLYEKLSTRKVTYDLSRGNPIQHLQNPQKPNRTKDTGFLRSRGGKMKKKFKLTSGAPFARCATSNRKKYSFKFFLEKMWSNLVKLIILEY